MCVAGKKREAGDAIVETREGAAQARVGFELCAMDPVPSPKTSPQIVSSRTLKSQKLSKTLETLETLRGLNAWSETSPCPRILAWPPLLDGGQKCKRREGREG